MAMARRRQTAPREYIRGRPLFSQLGERATWLTLPSAIILVVVVVLPVALGIYIAFFSLNVYNLSSLFSAPFVGIKNLVFVVTNDNSTTGTAIHAVWVSVAFAVLSTLVATPIGVLAAISVSHRSRGRAALRSAYLVPYVIPVVVVATVGHMMFLNGTGLVDRVMGALGASRNMYWLIGPNSFWAMLAVEIWIVWPFTYLLLLAGLAAVPDELYEAVEIDGGKSLAKLRYVAFPEVRGLLLLSMVLSVIFHLGNFTLPYVMFTNPPPTAVQVLPIAVYYQAFSNFQYGDAAATGLFMMIIFAIPACVYIRATRLQQAVGVGGAAR
jgi:multiple sugar transport system permease protein